MSCMDSKHTYLSNHESSIHAVTQASKVFTNLSPSVGIVNSFFRSVKSIIKGINKDCNLNFLFFIF